MSTATVKVHVHDSSFSTEELLIAPESFPSIGDGDVVTLSVECEESTDRNKRLRASRRRSVSLPTLIASRQEWGVNPLSSL